jgi:hypothetical protein
MPNTRTTLLSSAAHTEHDTEPKVNPALYSIHAARQRAGDIGVTKLYELIAQGELVAVKLGGRTFIRAGSLDAFIANLHRADVRTGLERQGSSKRTSRSPRPEFQKDLASITEAALLLLDEFEAANAHHGGGIHREPRVVLRDLREELNSLREVVGKIREPE